MLQEEDEESKQWLSIQSERIVRSAEAAVVILNITTAQNMPKQVYLEEAIEHVATFCQHHLESIIFPEFDPIYRSADVKGMTKSMFHLNQIPLLCFVLVKMLYIFFKIELLKVVILCGQTLKESKVLKMWTKLFWLLVLVHRN